MESVNKLIEAINPAISKLSETFCVSVDAIRENGMHYVMMYGRYHYIDDMVSAEIVTLLFVMAVLIVIFVIMVFEYNYGIEDIDAYKNVIKIAASVTLFLMLVVFITHSIPYWLCPEVYSIEAVMELAGL